MICANCKRPRWDGQSDQDGFCLVGDISLATPGERAWALRDCKRVCLEANSAHLQKELAKARSNHKHWKQRFEFAEAKIGRLQKEFDRLNRSFVTQLNLSTELSLTIVWLREALKKYADPNNWDLGTYDDVQTADVFMLCGAGRIAQEALNQVEE